MPPLDRMQGVATANCSKHYGSVALHEEGAMRSRNRLSTIRALVRRAAGFWVNPLFPPACSAYGPTVIWLP